MNGKTMNIPTPGTPSNDNGFMRKTRKGGCWIGMASVLAVLGAGGGLLSRQEADASSASEDQAALTVTTARPGRANWPDDLTAQGAVAPWEEASIGTQIGNYQLIDVRANVGDEVRRGQVLARLNPALLQTQEAQSLALYEQAVANDHRARGLRQVGGISDQEALQFSTEAKTAKAVLAAKRLELRYTSILAPDDGVITARTATLGAVVPAGQELFRMIRRNRLEWRGELTASQLTAARRGQAITLALPDGSGARAVIREFAPSLDAGSRLAIVYADLAPGSTARAGMYAAGTISVGTSPALTVPAESIVLRDGRSYVMAIISSTSSNETRVRSRACTTGRRRDGSVEILQGLAGTERLVLRGAAFLNDGDVIRVVDAGKVRP